MQGGQEAENKHKYLHNIYKHEVPRERGRETSRKRPGDKTSKVIETTGNSPSIHSGIQPLRWEDLTEVKSRHWAQVQERCQQRLTISWSVTYQHTGCDQLPLFVNNTCDAANTCCFFCPGMEAAGHQFSGLQLLQKPHLHDSCECLCRNKKQVCTACVND